MQLTVSKESIAKTKELAERTVFPILLMISFSHLLNDTIQSLIPSIYPIVKKSQHLSFAQIGLITLSFQLAASIFQPLVGIFTDRYPQPFSLATSMAFTLTGLVLLSQAGSFHMLVISVAIIGTGSSIFHPEASKVAYMAAGKKRGLAQSIFQVGGNAGSSLGPLLAALIVVPYGQFTILWFSALALMAIIVLYNVGKWYSKHIEGIRSKLRAVHAETSPFSRGRITISIIILLVLIFYKYF
jgi:FSR family fosmidomycin resistance protein-like MFS transporter